jgi:hypothetical protein
VSTSTEKIHLSTAALITDPRIWPGQVLSGLNTLGAIAYAAGASGIQYHPFRTLGTRIQPVDPGVAKVRSLHDGFRSEQSLLESRSLASLGVAIFYPHHSHTKRFFQQVAATGSDRVLLPVTRYLRHTDTRIDPEFGTQSVQLSRADLRGAGILSGDHDPLTKDKLNTFLHFLKNAGFGLCLDTFHSYELLRRSGMNWERTIEYLLVQQQICPVTEVHTSCSVRNDSSSATDISISELEKFYTLLKQFNFQGHITIEAPLHRVSSGRVSAGDIPALYRPYVQQIRQLVYS